MDLETNLKLFREKKKKNFVAKIFINADEKLRLIFRNPVYNKYIQVIVGFTCFNCEDFEEEYALDEDLKEGTRILENIQSYNSKIFYIQKLFADK